MAYQKINNYPSLKTGGVYPSGSFKQLGLDSDDLKKFSLGNWTSIVKGNVIFTYRENQQDTEIVADPNGRPIRLLFNENRFDAGGMTRLECKQTSAGSYINVSEVQRNTTEQINNGHRFPTIGSRNAIPNVDIDEEEYDEGQGADYDADPNEKYRAQRHVNLWGRFYTGAPNVTEEVNEEVEEASPGNNTVNISNFNNPQFKSARELDSIAYIVAEADGNILKVKFFNEDNDIIMNPSNLIWKRIYDDEELEEGDPRQDTSDGAIGAGDYFEEDSNRNAEFFFPTLFSIALQSGPSFTLGRCISIPELSSAMSYDANNFVFDITNTTLGDATPPDPNNDADSADIFLIKLGFPNFEFNAQITSVTPTASETIDFKVEVKTQEGNELIYHDRKENLTEYIATSYPVEATLNISLYDDQNFQNVIEDLDISATLSDLYYLTADVDIEPFLVDFSYSIDQSYFTYQVIQWGDEGVLLSDDEIQSTFFFSLYDSDEYPSDDNYFLRKSIASQSQQAIGIENQTNHVYNTPGVKSIKIIIYRYDKSQSVLLQTYLVTKNIVINDGLLTSQDFSIFGGSDFTFLPIVDNQAIIGGFDEESKYNKSVEKITKDDDFIAEDYLQRASSRDYIEKFNDSLLGKRPGQLDLGQVRLFNQPRDLYDFIGGDKLQWITNGSGSLPLNSSATDIFIGDDNCLVDFNPSNSEFNTLQNQVGLKEVGVLTGDYKLNQPKDSIVQKQGLMEVPLLDDDIDKQAF